MAPILGILASQITGHLGPVWTTSDYESISTVTVGSGGSSSISFTSIPSTYKHLQVRFLVRSTTTNGDVSFFVNSTLFSSRRHTIFGDGTTASGGSDTANAIARQTQSTDTASTFAVSIIDILEYANTNKYKTIRELGGFNTNGSGALNMTTMLIQNTAAITSVKLEPYTASGSFAEYSHFALYGIKG